VLIWNAVDLGRKLEEFRNYYNENRVHQSLSGRTPGERSGQPPPAHAVLDHYAWRYHCRGLFPAHPTADWIAQQITEGLSLGRGPTLPDP
jgi:hypothetical protein